MNASTRASAGWARTACGVDDAPGRLIVIRATRRGGGLTFERAEPADLAGGAVAACLLQRESFVKWITAPLTSARKAERVFPSLLDVQLPFSVEDCAIALAGTRAAADGAGTRGLMAGARNDAVGKRLDALQAAGVTPHVLDQEGLALWSQALAEFPVPADDRAARIVTYMGADRTTLVVGQGDSFLGAHSLRQADPDQLVRLLKSYFPERPEATRWFWAGPLAAEPAGADPLAAQLAARWPGSVAKTVRDPETFLARALAARAVSSGPCRCNLRTGAFLHPFLREREVRAPYRRAAAILAAGLVLIAINGGWQHLVQRRLAGLQDRIRAFAVDIAGSPRLVPRGQEVLTARRALETQTLQYAPFLAAADAPLTETLKAILSVAQEEGLTIETLTLTRKSAVVHGLAPKWSQCEKAAGRLKAFGTDLKAERRDTPAGGDRVGFVITMGIARER